MFSIKVKSSLCLVLLCIVLAGCTSTAGSDEGNANTGREPEQTRAVNPDQQDSSETPIELVKADFLKRYSID